MKNIVAIANDHAGVALKRALLPEIESHGFSVLDLGAHTEDSVDYPDFGKHVAETVTSGKAKFGIAICGSGVGISIAANRIKGARAALCHSGLTAQLARQHNDANILALGARLIGSEEAKECLHRFLTTEFEGGRHSKRIDKLG
jgi:ribose 5-phosphate isomerase B